MSQIEVNLCSLLLREYFGEVVQKTGTYLMEQVCGRPLRQIIEGTSLPVKKVKSCLRVLIFHHFCDFNLNKKNIVEYSMNIKQVLLLIQYPRYMYSAKILYGDAAELLVEELLNNGRMIMSRAIQKVVERLQEATGKDYTMKEIASVKSKFVDLVEAKFFKRCPMPTPSEGDGPIPVMSLSSKEEYLVPEIKLYLLGKDSSNEPPVEQQNFKQIDASGEHEGHDGPSSKKRRIADSDFAVECSSHDIQPSKKQKIEKEPFPDKGIYWRINNDRFHQYFRDESIVSAVANIHGRKASDVVRTLLRMSETRSDPWVCSTNPIARHEILPVLLKGTNVQDYELDSFLSILSEHPYSFLSKVDERSGGMYVVNISKCLQQVVEALATAVVRDSFGNRCSRIFNLLLSTKNLEQKYIEEIAMISAREAKQLTYRLLKENFIIAKEIPKTQDHVPSREIYVLSADVTQVCRSLLQKCYKQIINALIRFESISRENKRLLDKKQRIDAIVNTLQLSCADFSQVEEVEQMITPPERMILEKVKNSTEKLEACQIQLAEDIYLLKIWLDSLPLK